MHSIEFSIQICFRFMEKTLNNVLVGQDFSIDLKSCVLITQHTAPQVDLQLTLVMWHSSVFKLIAENAAVEDAVTAEALSTEVGAHRAEEFPTASADLILA